MKFLVDSCVSGVTAETLRLSGHDVLWCGDLPSDPGDEQILSLAHEQERVLITIDKDFGELAVVHGRLHHGIVRLIGFRSGEQADAILRIIAKYERELRAGSLITAEPWRVRLRPR